MADGSKLAGQPLEFDARLLSPRSTMPVSWRSPPPFPAMTGCWRRAGLEQFGCRASAGSRRARNFRANSRRW